MTSKIEELQQEVASLKTQLEALLAGKQPQPQARPKVRKDFIEFGSEAHATLLGLRKNPETGEYELADPVQYAMRFGPAVTPDFLKSILNQKLQELNTRPSVPANAPEMWRPTQNPIEGLVF